MYQETKHPKVRYSVTDELPTVFHTSRKEEGETFWADYDLIKEHRGAYPPNKIPRELKIPLYVNYKISTGSIKVHDVPIYLDSDEADRQEINLATLVLTLPVPEVNTEDCVKTLVNSLKREKQKIMAEAQRKAMELDNRIGELLAIEYKVDGKV